MREKLKAAIRNLIDGEDDTGCDGLTVVEKDAFDKLKTLFQSMGEAQVKSTHVKTIMLETGEEVEIRRLEGGVLVGFDGAYLSQLVDGEHPNNPYDDGKIVVPDDEYEPTPKPTGQIVLTDDVGGGGPYLHGILDMKPGEAVENTKVAIEAAREQASQNYPEEWNYGEVIDILRKQGYTVRQDCHLWVE